MTNCCKIMIPAPKPPPVCNFNLCDAIPLPICDSSEEDMMRRDLGAVPEDEYEKEDDMRTIEKRLNFRKIASMGNGIQQMASGYYPGRKPYYKLIHDLKLPTLWYAASSDCTTGELATKLVLETAYKDLPANMETDHTIDVSPPYRSNHRLYVYMCVKMPGWKSFFLKLTIRLL